MPRTPAETIAELEEIEDRASAHELTASIISAHEDVPDLVVALRTTVDLLQQAKPTGSDTCPWCITDFVEHRRHRPDCRAAVLCGWPRKE